MALDSPVAQVLPFLVRSAAGDGRLGRDSRVVGRALPSYPNIIDGRDNLLSVTLITFDPESGDLQVGDDVHEVEYVSQYNGGTHGPPALVAPGRESGQAVPPRARVGDTVLYINTQLVPAYKVTRLQEN